jgi:hypothetical protein
MALTRRRFVRAAGIGAAGALTSSWIGARGRRTQCMVRVRADAAGRRTRADRARQQ